MTEDRIQIDGQRISQIVKKHRQTPSLRENIAVYVLETMMFREEHIEDCPRCTSGLNCIEAYELQEEILGSVNAYREIRNEDA